MKLSGIDVYLTSVCPVREVRSDCVDSTDLNANVHRISFMQCDLKIGVNATYQSQHCQFHDAGVYMQGYIGKQVFGYL